MKLSAEDRAWSVDVKQRERYTCQRCLTFYPEGRRQGIQAHHIFTRSRRSTRWDLVNGVALCTGCHRWAHSNPLEFHELARSWLGADVYDALQARSWTTRKVTA